MDSLHSMDSIHYKWSMDSNETIPLRAEGRLNLKILRYCHIEGKASCRKVTIFVAAAPHDEFNIQLKFIVGYFYQWHVLHVMKLAEYGQKGFVSLRAIVDNNKFVISLLLVFFSNKNFVFVYLWKFCNEYNLMSFIF